MFDDILKHLENRFGLEVEYGYVNDKLYLRIPGLDNVSLTKYIREEFPNVVANVKWHQEFQYSDKEFIRIKNDFRRTTTTDITPK